MQNEDKSNVLKEIRQLYEENMEAEIFTPMPDLCAFPAATIHFIHTRTPAGYGGAVREIDGILTVICRTNGVASEHEKAEIVFEKILSSLLPEVPGRPLFLEKTPLIVTKQVMVSAGPDYGVARIFFTLKVLGEF